MIRRYLLGLKFVYLNALRVYVPTVLWLFAASYFLLMITLFRWWLVEVTVNPTFNYSAFHAIW